MKTIKIDPAVHLELKSFIAQNPVENMSDFSGFAILTLLKTKGHKFVLKATKTFVKSPKIKSPSTNNKK